MAASPMRFYEAKVDLYAVREQPAVIIGIAIGKIDHHQPLEMMADQQFIRRADATVKLH